MNGQVKILRALRPIKTKRDYKRALRLLERIFDATKGTMEANIAEILSVLIEKYEEERFPIETPDPIDAIKFRMEQLGMSNKQLVDVIGSRSRVSEILSGKRGLSISIMRVLHNRLQIPAEVLLHSE